MTEINLIDLYINDQIFSDLSQEVLEERKNIIFQEIARLEAIKIEINNICKLQEKIISKHSQLHHVLGAGSKSGLTLNYQIIKGDTIIINKIGPLIYEAYMLTSKILQQLGIINTVNYTFTYSGASGFMRAENLQIDPQNDLTFEVHRGALIIRLKESHIKNKILANQTSHNIAWVSEHYKKFMEPLYQAETKGRFKINLGVASEAFERHWEEYSHQIENKKMDRFGGVGRIWYLYRISSGNDPYYTGPDTAIAQVKNANASIISNADTVLNTIQAILKLVHTKTNSLEEALVLKEKYSQSFAQKNSETQTISRNIWESVDKDVQEMIMKEFGAKEAILKKKFVIFK